MGMMMEVNGSSNLSNALSKSGMSAHTLKVSFFVEIE